MKRLAALLLVATLAATQLIDSASAAPPASPPPQANSVRAVTLVTGDRVVLSGSGSSQSFSFVPAQGRPSHGYVSSRIHGQLTVIPNDVASLVPTVLDPALFNINTLLEERGDDKTNSSVPVIIQGNSNIVAKGIGRRRLNTLDATAVKLDKSAGKDFGSTLVAAKSQQNALSSGKSSLLPHKVWLDRRMKLAVDPNLEQIGAPAAWSAGMDGSGQKIAIIDTGIDSNHPDLRSQVVTQRNFSDSPTVDDSMGHGTHVASIAAGSGAAASGERKGVAFNARILSAKVLGDDGHGDLSDIIAGVEWAGEQGAGVANISIQGNEPSDGSDPLSMAIDATTRSRGTLFVVAAGNQGAPNTIASPAAANSALTVGAVDANDNLADFSSSGPRLGGGIKPEITAPGVDIIAANAGSPDGQHYIRQSGTSMAAPHVAGAAALVRAQHPTWSPAQVKAALVETASESAGTNVNAQGGGRLDVAHATRATVLADDPTIDLGTFAFPQTSKPGTRTLTWTNHGSAPTTVDFTIRAAGLDSKTVSVSPSFLNLAAGASGQVTLSINPGTPKTAPDVGVHGGEVVATPRNGGIAAGVPFSFEKESEKYDLTVRVPDAAANPTASARISIFNVDDMALFATSGDSTDEKGQATVRVPPGNYHVEAVVDSRDEHNAVSNSRWVIRPQIRVKSNSTIVLDSRKAKPVDLSVYGKQTQLGAATIAEQRTDAKGNVAALSVNAARGPFELSATPTDRVTVGQLDTYVNGRLLAPLVRIQGDVSANPYEVAGSAKFRGDKILRVLHGAGAAPTDSTRVAAGEALVVVKRSDPRQALVMHAALRAKPAAVVIVNDQPGPWTTQLQEPSDIPVLTLDGKAGAALIRANTVRVTGTDLEPYTYDVVYRNAGSFPESNTHVVHRREAARMARVSFAMANLRGTAGDVDYGSGRTPVVEGFRATAGVLLPGVPGIRRVEYVQPGKWVGEAYRRSSESFTLLTDKPRSERYRGSRTETWFQGPWRPSTRQVNAFGTSPAAVRNNTTMMAGLPPLADSDRHVKNFFGSEPGLNLKYILRKDGAEIASGTNHPSLLPMPAAAGSYELAYEVDAAGLPSRPRSATVWRFKSVAPGSEEFQPLPLLEVDTRLPLDLGGTLNGRDARVTVRKPFAETPTLKSIKVEISTDGAHSWNQLGLQRRSGSSVDFKLPKLTKAAELSLRVTAEDMSGMSVTQTLTNTAAT